MILFVDEKESCHRFRFRVWLQVRRAMEDSYWNMLSAASRGELLNTETAKEVDDDGLGMMQALREVPLNLLLGSLLPIRCASRDDLFHSTNDMVPVQNASLANVRKVLEMRGFFKEGPSNDCLPSDANLKMSSVVDALLQRDDRSSLPCFFLEWTGAWLESVRVDEVSFLSDFETSNRKVF